jgi:hypothetical protein
MIKMPGLFVRVFAGRAEPTITREVTLGCEWVLAGEGTASLMWDGTACAVINGVLHKRYDAKGGKAPPVGAIPCQPEPDATTGHWPHWIAVDANNQADKWHVAAWTHKVQWFGLPADGTYELIGPAIGANAECFEDLELKRHGDWQIDFVPRDFDGLLAYLTENMIEGIVFLHHDGRRCKIRRNDFGLQWGCKKVRVQK